MDKQHDKITTRLVCILTKLNSGERFTAKELAEEFNVSLRTLQRDLNERLSLLPIKKENLYYSLEPYALGRLTLKDIKNFATVSGIKSLYPSLTDDFIVDILNMKVSKAFLVKDHSLENIQNKKDEFELLSKAILKFQQINFVYKDKIRDINPYNLVNNNGIWYLVGDEDGTLKTFSFTKISNLKFLDNFFTPSSEFLDIIKKNQANWFSQTVIDVTLEIDGSVAEYFLRREILPNQVILEKNHNKLILSTKISYDDEILSIVGYWLPHITILSPLYLQEKLNNTLTHYLKTTQPKI